MTTIFYGAGDSIKAGFGLTPHAAWTATTSYTAIASDGTGDFVANGGHDYACIHSGTSAGSGGPAGTGLSITDGSAIWAHIGTNSDASVPSWFTVMCGILLARGKVIGLDNEAVSGTSFKDWVGATGVAGSWWFVLQGLIDSSAAARVALISLGTNDFSKISGGSAGYTSYTGLQVLDNAVSLARQAQAKQCSVVLTNCMFTTNFTDSVNGNGLTAYNDFQAGIAGVCTANGWGLLDFQSLNAGVAKQDGTHPTAAGARVLAAYAAAHPAVTSRIL